ncbi:MAG: hypothetical protein GMKNLPBB_01591 [Myxococcota bacterium]|nr:hypothetical protein [Myxococcota bacterium]
MRTGVSTMGARRRLPEHAGRAVLAMWALLSALWIPRGALASPFDEYGYSARFMGMADAGTALATGASGAVYNPGGIALAPFAEAELSWRYAAQLLRLDGRSAGLAPAQGLNFGISVPGRLGGEWRYGFAVAATVPDQVLLRIRLLPSALPHFVMYDNRIHRLAGNIAAGVSWRGLVSFGGGIMVLANASGEGIRFFLNTDLLTNNQAEATVDLRLPTRITPIAGLRFDPLDWLTIGVAYRHSISIDIDLDVMADIGVDNELAKQFAAAGADRFTGTAAISISNSNYFTPSVLTMGIAVRPLDWLTAAVQLDHERWSDFPDPVTRLKTTVELGKLSPYLADNTLPSVVMNDRWTPRIGVEFHRGFTDQISAALRLGYAFVSSPVPDVTGPVNLIDADRHHFSLGAGAKFDRFTSILMGPLGVDAYLQWRRLMDRTITKSSLTDAQGAYTVSGDIIATGFSLSLQF